MAVTTDQLITRGNCDKSGGPVAASTTLYGGTMAFVNASGYLDDDTNSGANTFAGIVPQRYDNSAGANGDISADVWNQGQFELVGSGFSQADVGAKVYASDNYTITKTSTSNTYIGTIRKFISATKVIVEIDTQTP